MSCSVRLRNQDKVVSNILTAQNLSDGTFEMIAGFYAPDKPVLTPFGERLFANKNPVLKESNNTLSLTFDNLTCKHERLYRCSVRVRKSLTERTIESDVTSISVTGKHTISLLFSSLYEVHCMSFLILY